MRKEEKEVRQTGSKIFNSLLEGRKGAHSINYFGGGEVSPEF